MKKSIALSDRVTHAAALAEAISCITLCLKSSGALFGDARTAPAAFLGIEKLSDVLSDELMDIADDVYKTESGYSDKKSN